MGMFWALGFARQNSSPPWLLVLIFAFPQLRFAPTTQPITVPW
jgi:hypothetical protein